MEIKMLENKTYNQTEVYAFMIISVLLGATAGLALTAASKNTVTYHPGETITLLSDKAFINYYGIHMLYASNHTFTLTYQTTVSSEIFVGDEVQLITERYRAIIVEDSVLVLERVS
jgi:hypothetical protein